MLSSVMARRAFTMPRCWSSLPKSVSSSRINAIGGNDTSRTRSLSTSTAAAASLSLDQLKQLRTQTGAPVVDCKKALTATRNDVAAALDWLREHGVAKVSAKVAGRTTSEGLVALQVAADGGTAALVQVASETDFASRSPNFVLLIQTVAEVTLHEGEVAATDVENKTVKAQLDDAMVAIRENLSIARALQWQKSGDDCVLVGYVHNKVDSSADAAAVGMTAALVEMQGLDQQSAEALQAVGKKMAMHIVAARPSYIMRDDVSEAELDKERAILTKQVAESGKSDDIVAKMVEGRLRKFYEEICLTEQEHMIEEGNPKIEKYLREQGMVVKRFELMSIR